MSRVDEDMYYMWTVGPSEWSTEYWEVFALFGGLAFLLLLCVFYVCCILPCLDARAAAAKGRNGNPNIGDRTEMTQQELDDHNRAKAKYRQQRSKLLLPKMMAAAAGRAGRAGRGSVKAGKDATIINEEDDGGGIDPTFFSASGGVGVGVADWETPFVRMTDEDGNDVEAAPQQHQQQQQPGGDSSKASVSGGGGGSVASGALLPLLEEDASLAKSPTALAREDLLRDEDDVGGGGDVGGGLDAIPSRTTLDDTLLSNDSSAAAALGDGPSPGGVVPERRKGAGGRAGWTSGATSLWSETVDVWSEFLGFQTTTAPRMVVPPPHDDDDDEDAMPRRRSDRKAFMQYRKYGQAAGITSNNSNSMSKRTTSKAGDRRKGSSRRSLSGKSGDDDDSKSQALTSEVV